MKKQDVLNNPYGIVPGGIVATKTFNGTGKNKCISQDKMKK